MACLKTFTTNKLILLILQIITIQTTTFGGQNYTCFLCLKIAANEIQRICVWLNALYATRQYLQNSNTLLVEKMHYLLQLKSSHCRWQKHQHQREKYVQKSSTFKTFWFVFSAIIKKLVVPNRSLIKPTTN